MSDLSWIEKINLEKLFRMEDGWVLDFNNRTFRDFVYETVRVDIYDERYNILVSGSKANRLRAFWQVESNYLAGKLNKALVEVYVAEYEAKEGEVPYDDWDLYSECKAIAERLLQNASVEELDAIAGDPDDADFDMLARHIRESVQRDEPQGALDRLHTYVTRFIRQLCDKHEITYKKTESLNAIFGKYVRFLVNHEAFESKMSEAILKFSISILDAFNGVRNDQSLAHDNPAVLNYSESLLIVNNVTNAVKFIKTLEDRLFPPPPEESPSVDSSDQLDDDLPF